MPRSGGSASGNPRRRSSRSPRRPRASSRGAHRDHQQQQQQQQQQKRREPATGGRTTLGGGLSGPFRSFLKVAGLTAAAKTTSELGRGGGSQEANGDPGQFGLYLFAQSWAPRFCCKSGVLSQ